MTVIVMFVEINRQLEKGGFKLNTITTIRPTSPLQLDSIQPDKLISIDLACVHSFTTIIRSLEEIHDLFELFCFNCNSFDKNYHIFSSSHLQLFNQPSSHENFITINNYLINIISYGKTLVDAMETITKEKELKGSGVANYIDIVHQVYDTSFSYRLMYFLRNFSQHGHLPISYTDKTYCINLELILSTTHFNFKGKQKNELERITKEIIEQCNQNPTLNLTIQLAEYTSNILNLYEAFWCCISYYFISLSEKVTDLLHQYPNNFINHPNHLEQLFIIEFQPHLELLPLKTLTESPFIRYHAEALDLLQKTSDFYKKLLHSILQKSYFINY